MKLDEALKRLEAVGPRQWTPTRLIGYAYLIQRDGWEGVSEYITPGGIDAIRGGYQEGGVDPLAIEFDDNLRLYLEELVRTSGHPGAAQPAEELLENSADPRTT